MLNNLVLGKYILKKSLVHSLNPVFKIISILIMIISFFYIDSYVDIIILSFYLLLVMSYSNISFKVYLKNIFSIRIFLIFITTIDLIFYKGIDVLFFDLFKLIFIVLYSSILTFTTAMTEITYGIERILKPFANFIPINDISMITALTLRYIPTLTIEANRIVKIQTLRGIDFKTKNIKEKILAISGVFTPMFILSIQKSLSMADIMDIRLYNYGKSRTNYRLNPWSLLDTSLLILNLLIFIIVIYY